MAAHSDIEWTDASWTPIRARNLKTGKVGWHCVHKSTGCEFCYADSMNKRLGTGLPFKPGHEKDIEIFLDDDMLLAPLRWRRPRRVFVCSMTDLFAEFVKDEWIDKVLAVAALCPQHTFQVLTKRPERMRECVIARSQRGMLDERICDSASAILRPLNDIRNVSWNLPAWPLMNLWAGTSCERQQEAEERIPELLQTPAAVRFVSLEPLLGPIDLGSVTFERRYGTGLLNALTGEKRGHVPNSPLSSGNRLDWVIVGGESGPHARPMHPDWARALRDQCKAAGVPMFFKQWGAWAPHYGDKSKDRQAVCKHGSPPFEIPAGERARQFDLLDRCQMIRVGKKAAGRLLDGREHNDIPDRVQG